MMAPQVPPSFVKLFEFIVDPTISPLVKLLIDAVLAHQSGYLFRGLVAMAITKTPWNLDAFDGFAYERSKLIEGFAKHTNNPIILFGDSHDSWASTLYENGYMDGKSRAVNLGCPGVTSPGWGELFQGTYLLSIYSICCIQ